MSLRVVPKSVTLNDLERRNVPYFSLFHQIRVLYVVAQEGQHPLTGQRAANYRLGPVRYQE